MEKAMKINEFLKGQLQKKEEILKNSKKKIFKKGNFRDKCFEVIKKITEISEEKGLELKEQFVANYNNDNIPKKRILGFYGQIMSVYKNLKDSVQKEVEPIVEAVKTAEKNVEAVVVDTVSDVVTKVQKVVEKKKVKTVIKKAVKTVAKKTEKKVEKRPTKKIAKKTAKKIAKKTTKKNSKK